MCEKPHNHVRFHRHPRIEPPASKPGMGWPARITLALLLIGAIFAVLHLATGWAREGALRRPSWRATPAKSTPPCCATTWTNSARCPSC